ncbi:hypothetical protein [Leptospira kmetyi]|uniref:Uncharacterized protein n=1 Tax=Leptospira kmetyi TaxID=408139 RepID=A0A2M9XSG7_9LEPT|nr:hypothetical protein [Leptospira kmetyi]AYV56506.1 hypothetical protein EFP84_13995 [Leptospira kmetyi]EQA54969.1 hypothetical protein LEP1GSC052_4196 [Leptospira kmetyi serovar Malaysia str. Bejo-Iso9]PJZ30681.1 hypothetical protein CH378_06070 [Leptospira kmetyi]PJZ42260.1 hypothetical protein CH370_08530 [Leptospira kmetyi]TGL71131.1 hypothetical protein EHQ67_04490 [Leptospira kmetyi]
MTVSTRRLILRVNGIVLILASTVSFFVLDILGIYYGFGPEGRILQGHEFLGIGFFEAHGLALILGIHLFRAEPKRSWHLTAMGAHFTLGTANLLFWKIFIVSGSLPMGYGTTGMHWFFVLLQLLAAIRSPKEE